MIKPGDWVKLSNWDWCPMKSGKGTTSPGVWVRGPMEPPMEAGLVVALAHQEFNSGAPWQVRTEALVLAGGSGKLHRLDVSLLEVVIDCEANT